MRTFIYRREALKISVFDHPPVVWRSLSLSTGCLWIFSQESCVIAGRTVRCCCKFRYVSKFTAASRSFHCDSMAFEKKAKCVCDFLL